MYLITIHNIFNTVITWLRNLIFLATNATKTKYMESQAEQNDKIEYTMVFNTVATPALDNDGVIKVISRHKSGGPAMPAKCLDSCVKI